MRDLGAANAAAKTLDQSQLNVTVVPLKSSASHLSNYKSMGGRAAGLKPG